MLGRSLAWLGRSLGGAGHSGREGPRRERGSRASGSCSRSVRIDRSDAADARFLEVVVRVLLVCGEADTVWSSCDFARAATAALDADPAAPVHELVAVPEAGHFIDWLFPGVPQVAAAELTPAQHAKDEAALPDVWRHVLAFLAALK